MLSLLEQKLLTLSRIALLILGIIFLVLSIWWLAFSIPAIGSSKEKEEAPPSLSNLDKNVMDLSELKESVWSASALEIDSDAFSQQDIMRLTKKDAATAAAYDEIIKNIRAFLYRDPKARAAIEETAQENYITQLAPVEWEALDKLSDPYCKTFANSEDNATEDAADAVAQEATDADDAFSQSLENAYEDCDYTTVRQAVVTRVINLMQYTTADERAQMHRAYVEGLAKSIKPLLANEDMAARLATVPSSRTIEIVLDAYNNWFEPKLYSSSDSAEEERLLSDASPLHVFKNPYFLGIIGFFFLFSYLMLMLSLSRIERHLRRPE